MTRVFILPFLCVLFQACISSGSENVVEQKNALKDSVKAEVIIPEPVTRFLSEKEIRDYITSAPIIQKNPKANKPFKKMDYNKAIAYDFEGSEANGFYDIIKDSRFAPTVRQQKSLTQAQADALTEYLGDSATYGAGTAACFEPHLAIVFYKNEKEMMRMSICLGCNYLNSSKDIPATEAKQIYVDEKVHYGARGFSKIGRIKINELCKELNFSHCVDTLNGMFDE